VIWYTHEFRAITKESVDLTASLKFQILIIMFILTYVFFLLLSICFIDIATRIDYRILSPVYIFGVIFMTVLLWDIKKFIKSRLIWKFMLLYVFVLIYCNTINTYNHVSKMHQDGIWYTSREWRASEVIEFLRFLPEDIPIYSNGPDVISILLGKESKMIPAKTHSTSRLPNQHFASDLARMNTDLQRNKGVVAYFDNITWRWYLPDKDELQELARLSLIRRAADGVVYHQADID
jgi:hypothetical protein